jgi:hypothetical protein
MRNVVEQIQKDGAILQATATAKRMWIGLELWTLIEWTAASDFEEPAQFVIFAWSREAWRGLAGS